MMFLKERDVLLRLRMKISMCQNSFLICQLISWIFPAKGLDLLLCFLSNSSGIFLPPFFLLFRCKMVRAEQHSAEVTDTRMGDQQWHSNPNLYLGHSLWGLNTSVLQTALVHIAFINKRHLNICSLNHIIQSNSNFKRWFFALPSHLLFNFKHLFGTRLR